MRACKHSLEEPKGGHTESLLMSMPAYMPYGPLGIACNAHEQPMCSWAHMRESLGFLCRALPTHAYRP